jgi:hypothetical protein
MTDCHEPFTENPKLIRIFKACTKVQRYDLLEKVCI